MSAADPEAFDDGAHDFTRTPDVSHVSNRKHQVPPNGAGGHRPFGVFCLEAELRDLRNHVFADTAQDE